jgi:CPA2 family monovalent cation:H+ antiporter-2
MPHDTGLIFTLAGAFGLAFVMGLAATRLKLPPLVGYLAAGILIGPFTPGYTANGALASELAEVGVILLMFGVGLHFAIRDLMAVRRIAVPGALLRIVVIVAITVGITKLWGWSTGSGLVFGVALSVASTVVVLRALEELGLLDSADGRLAVGWLVVEDLAMVIVLVLVPPLAPALGGTAAGAPSSMSLAAQLGLTLVKVTGFVVLMLYVGTRVIPWLLGRVARLGNRELFTLAVLAVALGIAVGAASLYGVTFELGAFISGVVIAESDLIHQAAADALQLQDAFAVLFFVSVGMLFDPRVLLREPLRVLEVATLIVAGKAAVTFGIVRAFGRPIHSALLISASLAQIGEFSFILAGLGITFGLATEEARSLILAGAIISITVNRFVFSAANAIERRLDARPALLARLNPADPPIDSDIGVPHGSLRDHVVLIGYGRVGRRIGNALDTARIPYVVVERDRVAVDSLRKRGQPAIFGDAARPGILDHVGLDAARLLVIASPDPYQAQRVIEVARMKNPSLHIAARTHSEQGQEFLERIGADRAFMGERELALSMAHHALVRMGRTDDEADETVETMRRLTTPGKKDVSPR